MNKPFLISLILVMLLSGAPVMAIAQTGSVKGKVIDSLTRENMKGATINMLQAKDSSFVAFVLSQDNGVFSFDKVVLGSYLLQVNFQGYDNSYVAIDITADKPLADVGNIYLQQEANVLEGVVIRSNPPIVMRGDTTEFNAGSFKTRLHAATEDLLRKLPGIDVGRDGSITAQGEEVVRVYVDGKRFFADDPVLAIRTIPAEIVEKIQLYDAKSDQAAFTGFDDGARVKTINIITKKDKRKGIFGKATAGVANKDLYAAALNFNKFNNSRQLSIVGQSNNINNQSFGSGTLLGSKGNGGYAGSAGQTTSHASGLNFRTPLSPSTETYGSYFYNEQRTNTEQNTRKQTFVTADTTTDSHQSNTNIAHSLSHKFNLNLESKIDTSNQVIIRPNLVYQQSDNNSGTITHITQTGGLNVSNSNQSSRSESKGYNGNIEALLQHRFSKRGRTLSLGFNSTFNNTNGSGSNYSVNQSFLSDGINYTTDTINQRYTTAVDGRVLKGVVTYTEPLSAHHMMQLEYTWSDDQNNSNRITYNYDTLSHGFSSLDTGLTNKFENRNISNQGKLSIKTQYDKFTSTMGMGIMLTKLSSINYTKQQNLQQHFVNLYPSAEMSYNINKQKFVRLNYMGSPTQPSIESLQDVTDYSDPLNIRQGNPALKPSFNHDLKLTYHVFSKSNMGSLFLFLTGQVVTNKIANSVITILNGVDKPAGVPESTPAGATVVRPVNINGNYSLSFVANYSVPLKRPKSNLNMVASLNKSQNANLQNDPQTGLSVKNYNRNYGLTGIVRFTTNLDKNFDFNFAATSTYNIATYSINPAQNGNYFSESLLSDFTYYTKNGWIASSQLDYRYYGRGAGYNTSVPLLNLSIGRQLFSNKSAEVKLSVFDLLNQNVSVSRTITQNYIQDVQSRVLNRYVMVAFTYNLSKFGSRKIPGVLEGKTNR